MFCSYFVRVTVTNQSLTLNPSLLDTNLTADNRLSFATAT